MAIDRFQVDVADLAEAFENLDDPRSQINLRHPLPSVLMIAVMAILAGAEGPTDIGRWANNKAEWLCRLLPLPHGVPQKDVYRRLLMSLNPAAFQACFEEWVQRLLEGAQETSHVAKPVLSIDGKTSRRSHDRAKNLGALHSVSVWAGDYGLTLAQVACEEKSNEITAIPEVLKLVDLKGALITIDAMGTQKAIAKQIVDGKGDYVLALKANHEKFHDAVIEYVNDQLDHEFQGAGARRHVTREKGHGRVEKRIYAQMPVPEAIAKRHPWAGLKTIGVVMLTTLRNGKQTSDVRYFISSLPMGVQQFARAVRGHWRIENSCHWVLDMVFREDESRIRQSKLRECFSWLNRFTLSLLKQHPERTSIAMKRRSCAWNDEFLLQVLTGATT